jgi:menaquinol-cytochrome c reductase iron-sulfur subunit
LENCGVNPDTTHTPPSPASDETAEVKRRQVLRLLSLALGTVGAAFLGVPVIGYILAPLLQKGAEIWRPVGAVDDFRIGKTVEVTFQNASPLKWNGMTAKTAAWLRRVAQEEFLAFTINCSHLGCPVRWEPRAELFLCPCHGGVYYPDGQVAAGPPPRGLARYPVRVRQGQVEIQVSPVPLEGLISARQ